MKCTDGKHFTEDTRGTCECGQIKNYKDTLKMNPNDKFPREFWIDENRSIVAYEPIDAKENGYSLFREVLISDNNKLVSTDANSQKSLTGDQNKDSERLNWLIKHEAVVVNDSNFNFWIIYVNEDAEKRKFKNPREAIDAAMNRYNV